MSAKVDFFDSKGVKTTQAAAWLDLEKPAKSGLIAQVIRIFLGNQRRGLAKAKTRGQVDGTTKKIYKQKGTGGARHGSRKAPIYVGGGKAHGPDGRQNYSAKLNKKTIGLAFVSALSDKQKSGCLLMVDYPEFKKTNQANKYFKEILAGYKSRLPILIIDPKTESDCSLYCHNLSYLGVKDVHTVNTYDILTADTVLVSNRCLPEIKKRGKLI